MLIYLSQKFISYLFNIFKVDFISYEFFLLRDYINQLKLPI